MASGRLRRGDRTFERLADEDLIDRICAGEARAFEVVYERHAKAAYSLAYRMMGAAGPAEEVTQEAFLAAWRAGRSYSLARGTVRTWLLGIVHHRAIDALRRSTRHSRRHSEDESVWDRLEAPGRTEDEVADRQQAGSIQSLLDRLPPDQRRVIDLAYFGGFTHVEIAGILEIPVGTVKGRMRLGLEKLRDSSEGLERDA
jgi:RNA polymerase sigma-70 factor (ECF subfamily)